MIRLRGTTLPLWFFVACIWAVLYLPFFFPSLHFTVSAFSSGSGTPSDPYQITTCAELLEIDDSWDSLRAYYILANDIDCSGIANFTPIGNGPSPDLYFFGRFDGDGRTISNLAIATSSTHVGLFGVMRGGVVRDLTLSGPNIQATSSNVGALVGTAYDSTFVGITVTGASITATTSSVGGIAGRLELGYMYASRLDSTSYATSTDGTLGGLIGVSVYGVISRGNVAAKLQGGRIMGGIVGLQSRTWVTDSSFTGVATTSVFSLPCASSSNMCLHGGIAGEMLNSTTTNSYSAGTISVPTGSNSAVGGIAGIAIGNTTRGDTSGIINSFAYASVTPTGVTYAGGVVGQNASFFGWNTLIVLQGNYYDNAGRGTGQTQCQAGTADGSQPPDACTPDGTDSSYHTEGSAPLVKWNFRDIWQAVSASTPTSRVLPYLAPSVATSTASCANLRAYVEARPDGWFELANSFSCSGVTVPFNAISQIDAGASGVWTTVATGTFAGTLDGNGNAISGISVLKPQGYAPAGYNAGLFSIVAGATFKDLVLSAGDTASVTAATYAGAIAGTALGTVFDNVDSAVPVNVTFDYAGGLVGYCSRCYVIGSNGTGPVTAVGDDSVSAGGFIGTADVALDVLHSTYAGTVSAPFYAGGILGTTYNYNINYTWSTANGASLRFSNVTTSGTINGGDNIGGLIGRTTSNGNNPSTNIDISTITIATSSMNIMATSSGYGYIEGAGGLIGMITEASFSPSASTILITNATSTGSVQATSTDDMLSIGGIVGVANDATFQRTQSTANVYVHALGATGWGEDMGGFGGRLDDVIVTDSSATGDVIVTPDALIGGSSSIGQVGGFAGFFDSRSATSSNLYSKGRVSITNPFVYSVGGFMGVGRGLQLNTVYSTSPVTVTWSAGVAADVSYVGGFMGEIDSTGSMIKNAFSLGSTTISVWDTGSSITPNNIGGFAGYSSAPLEKVYAAGNVRVTDTGAAQGASSKVGALTGEQIGRYIRDSFSVSGISLNNLSTSTIGGIVGSYSGGTTFSNDFFDLTRTGQALCASQDAGGTSGCTGVNAASAAPTYFANNTTNDPFTTWDFSTTWGTQTDFCPTLRFSLPSYSAAQCGGSGGGGGGGGDDDEEQPESVLGGGPAISFFIGGIFTDVMPPKISKVASAPVASKNKGKAEVTVTWETDEPASSKVLFGLTPALGFTTPETDTNPRKKSHVVVLPEVACAKNHHFAVVSSDAGGNTAVSPGHSFNTLVCAELSPPPTEPPPPELPPSLPLPPETEPSPPAEPLPLPTEQPEPEPLPTEPPYVVINNDEDTTDTREVEVVMVPPTGATTAVLFDPEVSDSVYAFTAEATTTSWDLCKGELECPDGRYLVGAYFVLQSGEETTSIIREITLDTTTWASVFQNGLGRVSITSTVEVLRAVGIASGVTGITWTIVTGVRNVGDIPLLVGQFISTVFSLGFFRRRNKKTWGTVYDSVTRRPLDPVIVKLFDASNKELQMAITDLDGRYGFLASPGEYHLTALKSHHVFPATNLPAFDPLYQNPYTGGPIIIGSEDAVVVRDIPLQPTDFDWNEAQKYQHGFYRFYSRFDRPIAYLSLIFVPLGVLSSILAVLVDPSVFNISFLVAYGAILIMYASGFRPRLYGIVRDKQGGVLAFAVLKVFRPGTTTPLTQAVTDAFGRYYLLLPPETRFDVTIEARVDEHTYKEAGYAHFSSLRGYLNKNIRLV